MKQILKPEEFLKILSTFLSETNDGFAILDFTNSSLTIVYVNKGFTNITGYSDDEVIGESLCDILGQNFKDDCHKNILNNLEKKETFTFETKYLKKDNNIRSALISFTLVVRATEETKNAFIIIEDITEKILHIEEQAKFKAARIVIESINDVVFNYMNYLILFHEKMLEINGELKNNKLQEMMMEFEKEFRRTFESLKKLSDLSSFRTKFLSKSFEILDI